VPKLTDNNRNWGFALFYHNREAIGMEADFSLPTGRVIRELKQMISWREKPLVIRCDNGP
jgi:putative transposase